jgi:hypothetical protein
MPVIYNCSKTIMRERVLNTNLKSSNASQSTNSATPAFLQPIRINRPNLPRVFKAGA